jgi:hypothetical protein
VAQLSTLGGLSVMNKTSKERWWIRLPLAIILAFIASVITGLMFFQIVGFRSMSVTVLACSNLLVGFNGVLAGGVCFRRIDRVLGAIVLVVFGVSFEIMLVGFSYDGSDKEIFHFPRQAIITGIGGLFAVAFYYWRGRTSLI